MTTRESGPQCPRCGGYKNRVIDSRLNIRQNIRYRLRICQCGAQITTAEKIINKRRTNNETTQESYR